MDTTALETLTVPPNATVAVDAAGWTITVRQRVDRPFRWLLRGLLVTAAAFAAGGLIVEAVRPPTDGADVSSSLVVEVGCFVCAAVFVGSWALFVAAVRRVARISLVNGVVTVGGPRSLVVSAADVRGVRIGRTDRPGVYITPFGPVSSLLRRGHADAVELAVEGGRVQALVDWDPETVGWVASALRVGLGTSAGDDCPSLTSIRTGQQYGAARWIGPGMLAAAAVLAAIVAGDVREACASRSWPTTVGRVTRSVYAVDHRGEHPSYEVELRYRYAVAGRDYDGDRIGVSRGDDEVAVRRVVEGHAEGSAIPVRYDPARPSRAVILPGNDVLVWLACVGTTVVAAYGGGLCVAIRPTREQNALAKRYLRSGWELKADAEDEGVIVRWEVPAAVLADDRQHARRWATIAAVRATAVTGVAAWAVARAFRPYATDLPVDRIVWIATGVPAAYFALVGLSTLLPARTSERRITAKGIRIPAGDKVPLVRWDRVAGYDVEPHPRVPGARLLVVRGEGGRLRRTALPLDDGAAAEILAAVAERLPRIGPSARDAPLRPIDGWVAVGYTVPFVWGGGALLGRFAGARHAHDWVFGILLAGMAFGPGTWHALLLRGRRAGDQLILLAAVVNPHATVALVVVAALHATGRHSFR